MNTGEPEGPLSQLPRPAGAAMDPAEEMPMVEEAVPPERGRAQQPAGRAVQLRAGATPSGRPARRPGSGPPPRRPGTGTLLKCVSQAIAVTDARCHADGGLTQCRRRRLYQDKVQIEPNEIVLSLIHI